MTTPNVDPVTGKLILPSTQDELWGDLDTPVIAPKPERVIPSPIADLLQDCQNLQAKAISYKERLAAGKGPKTLEVADAAMRDIQLAQKVLTDTLNFMKPIRTGFSQLQRKYREDQARARKDAGKGK